MTTLERLEAEVLGLSAAERTRLVERLLASLDEDDEIAAAWAAEAELRIAALARGESRTVPVLDAIAAARARLPGGSE